jgi:hypothetical protein
VGSATTIGTVSPSAGGASTGSGTFTFTAGHYIAAVLPDTVSCSVFPTIDASLSY